MKILFLHGRESQPGGSKVKHLEEQGHVVVNPYLPSHDFTESTHIAQTAFENEDPDVIVGSSRGGAVAMAMDSQDTDVVLIAPAWNHRDELEIPKNTKYTAPSRAFILHCREDEVVDYEDSQYLANILGTKIIECGKDHRMSDDNALSSLIKVIENL